jgi:hypothetical protein
MPPRRVRCGGRGWLSWCPSVGEVTITHSPTAVDPQGAPWTATQMWWDCGEPSKCLNEMKILSDGSAWSEKSRDKILPTPSHAQHLAITLQVPKRD